MTFSKKCVRCSRGTRSAGTICRKCERAQFPGVDYLRDMMTRQRIPCSCGNAAHAVVDFRPVCLSCKRKLRISDCNHRKDWKEARGICRECTNAAEPGLKHCAHHLAEGRERAAKSRDQNVFERLARMKCAAVARVADGKCRSCKGRHLPGRVLCAECRDKAAIRARNNYYARTKSKRTLAALELIYGHRSDALDPRGDFALGTDFTQMSQMNHAYASAT